MRVPPSRGGPTWGDRNLKNPLPHTWGRRQFAYCQGKNTRRLQTKAMLLITMHKSCSLDPFQSGPDVTAEWGSQHCAVAVQKKACTVPKVANSFCHEFNWFHLTLSDNVIFDIDIAHSGRINESLVTRFDEK